MKKGLLYIFALLLCCSCMDMSMNWPEPPKAEPAGDGVGWLSLRLTSDGMDTRATAAEVDPDTFLITIFKGEDRITDTVRLKDLNPVLDAGFGYVLQAENCTSETAEVANGGWGQKHFFGRSASFVIRAGETTTVKVACCVVNAGLAIDFDDAFRKRYPKCVVKMDGDRNISWRSSDSGTARVAYFNTGDDGAREVTFLVFLNGEDDPEPIGARVTLEAKKSITLVLSPKSETGTFSFSVTYAPDFTEATDDSVELE